VTEKKCKETGEVCGYECAPKVCYLIAATLIWAEQTGTDQIYDPENIPDTEDPYRKKKKRRT
jgi:hypothetical protein